MANVEGEVRMAVSLEGQSVKERTLKGGGVFSSCPGPSVAVLALTLSRCLTDNSTRGHQHLRPIHTLEYFSA